MNHSSSCQRGNVLPQTPQQDYVITLHWQSDPGRQFHSAPLGTSKWEACFWSRSSPVVSSLGILRALYLKTLIGVWIVVRHEKRDCLKQKLLFVFCAGLQVHSEIAIYTMCNQATRDMFGSLDVVLSSIRRQIQVKQSVWALLLLDSRIH